MRKVYFLLRVFNDSITLSEVSQMVESLYLFWESAYKEYHFFGTVFIRRMEIRLEFDSVPESQVEYVIDRTNRLIHSYFKEINPYVVITD